MVTMTLSSKSVAIIGHRGASGYEPENTLRSFKRAITMGADMIELDVRLGKLGELVVIHDDTIDRTTNGVGKIRDLSWDALKKYDAGKGEHIPLLSEVFDLVNKQVTIMIELKDPGTAKAVAELITSYVQNKEWSYNNFIVMSFDCGVIKEFHNQYPEITTGVIFEDKAIDPVDSAKKAGSQYVIIHYKLTTKRLITKAHASGLKVFPYTINSKTLAKKLRTLHIDGIITDYPDI
jgi:glycerophosphoryl diester phosphodiesterase